MKSLLVSAFRVSDIADLGWGLEFAFVTGGRLLKLLVWGPYFENPGLRLYPAFARSPLSGFFQGKSGAHRAGFKHRAEFVRG